MSVPKYDFDMTEAFESVAQKFKTYRQLLQGLADNRIRHLLVRGGPGLGKSFEADAVFAESAAKRVAKKDASGPRMRYRRFSGHTTPLGLYTSLWNARSARDIAIFDDCDAVWSSEQAFNILKAATDTRTPRTIAWHSSHRAVPVQHFTYEGQVLIITNQLLGGHRFASLVDRMVTYDLTLTEEERLARVIMVIRSDPRFDLVVDAVTMWLIAHYARLGSSLTVRTAIKAVELAATNRDKWHELAEATLLGGL